MFKILIASVFLFCLPTSLWAQGLDKKTGEAAIELAKKIQTEQLMLGSLKFQADSLEDELAQKKSLMLLRRKFNNSLWSAQHKALESLFKQYSRNAKLSGETRDLDIIPLYSAVLQNYNDEFTKESFEAVQDALAPFLNEGDWFVRHHAHNLKSLSYDPYTNQSFALETSQEGLKLIPSEDSEYVREARMLSLSVISFLNALLLNAENSVSSYDELVELQKASKSEIDGGGIINNLIYTFGAWHDQATRKELLNILLDLEKTYPSSIPGLTEMRAAKTYLELGNYDIALAHANNALKVIKVEALEDSVNFTKSAALAGLGKTVEARKTLTALQSKLSTEKKLSPSVLSEVYQTEALISAWEGDFLKAYTLMNNRLGLSIQEILSTNNSQTASVLASLQNSQERQNERALALQREAELKQIALERQQRITQLLIVLSVILLVTVIASIVFARYRSRVATRMEIAAKKAMAGEKSKAEFLAVMSHELRTPLNGIMGMADILARKADTQDLKEKTGIIVDCGQDLLNLVEDVFDMTLIESGDIHLYPERTNIHEMISKLIEKWRPSIESKGILFTAHIDESVPEYMEVDGNRLNKAVQSLLSNASKFTREGRVHIHVLAGPPAASGLTELRVIVADTGVGISKEARSRLFKPFVQADSSMTRHFGGAGLGLAISRGFVKMMGGDIVVNSRSERGSEFNLTINAPALSKPVQNVSSHAHLSQKREDAEATFSSLRILIAEDDIERQNVLRRILEPSGAKLIYTMNGQEALEALSLNPFDLVMTDIRMPGMDGITTIRRIRQSREDHSQIPIIALISDVNVETSARCAAAGVDMYLAQPVKAGDLFAAITSVLETRAAEKQIKHNIAS